MVKRFLIAWLALLLAVSPLDSRVAKPASAATAIQLPWQAGASLPQPAVDGVLFTAGARLYQAGGWPATSGQPSSAVYATSLDQNGKPGTWAAVGALPGGGRSGAAAPSYNGRAYMLGGNDGTNTLARVDSFNGASWRPEQPLPAARNFPGAALAGSRLYVAGGLPASGDVLPLDSVWSTGFNADGSLQGWRTERSLPVGLITELAGWDRCLYAIGGKDVSGVPRPYVYQAVLNTAGAIGSWTRLPDLPKPLAFHAVAVRDGLIYVLGGDVDTQADPTLNNQVYVSRIAPDCSLGAWTGVGLPYNVARSRAAAATAGRGIYLAGGREAGRVYAQDFWYQAIPAVELALRSNPNGPAYEGSSITYAIDYKVTGDGLAEDAVFSNTVPAGTQLVPGSILPAGMGTAAGGVVQWQAGALASPGQGTLSYQVRIPCSKGIVLGTAYDDRNGNGSQDSGEPGWAGATVQLIRPGKTPLTAVTDAGGAYSFTGLSFGTYQVQIVLPTGAVNTTAVQVGLTVQDSGDCQTGASFGLRRCYQITEDTDPHGAGSIQHVPAPNCRGGTGGQALYNPGTAVTLTASSTTGWRFDQWQGNARGSAASIKLVLDADKTITATFALDCSALTLYTQEPGSGTIVATPQANCPSKDGLYLNGTNVTLTATPNNGHAFQYWSGDAAGSGRSATVKVDRARSVTANFAACYPLVLDANAVAGAVTANPPPNCEGGGASLYNPGTTVSLTASPLRNYAFDHWSGNLAGDTNPISLTMFASYNVTANFAQCVSLSLAVDPPDAGQARILTPSNCPSGGDNYAPHSWVQIGTYNTSSYTRFQQWMASSGTIMPSDVPTTTWTYVDTNSMATAQYTTCKTLQTAAYPPDWGQIQVQTRPNCGPDRYAPGTVVALLAAPTQTHKWIGWSGDATGATSSTTITMDGDKSVTALFDMQCYALQFSGTPQGAGTVSARPDTNCKTESGKYVYGTRVSLTAAPTTGYTFSYWGGSASGAITTTTLIMDDNKSALAFFSSCHALSVTADPGRTGSVSVDPWPDCSGGGDNLYNPTTLVQLTANPGVDYAFGQWSGAVTSSQPVALVAMNANRSVTAHFQACAAVTATADPPGAGVAAVSTPPNCPGGGSKFLPGSTVIVTSSAQPGYVFDHWTASAGTVTNPAAPNTVLTVGTTDGVATAAFGTCRSLHTAASPTGWGAIDTSPAYNCGTDRYLPGTRVTLTARPATGKVFTQWSGDAAGSTASVSLTMDADKNVTAGFDTMCFPLATQPLPSGTAGTISASPDPNCPSNPLWYKYGTVVQAQAVPGAGYMFNQWGGDAVGNQNPITVTLTATRSLSANFLACYLLSVNVTPATAGGVSVSSGPNCQGGGANLYDPGSALQLQAMPGPGYAFSHWTGDRSSSDPLLDVTMSQAVSVTAVFSGTGKVVTTTLPIGSGADGSALPTLVLSDNLRRQVIVRNSGAYAIWGFNSVYYHTLTAPLVNSSKMYLPFVKRP